MIASRTRTVAQFVLDRAQQQGWTVIGLEERVPGGALWEVRYTTPDHGADVHFAWIDRVGGYVYDVPERLAASTRRAS